MRFAVFGGSRGTGLAFVEQALAAGHEVTLLARTPSKVTLEHAKLRVMKGDVLDEASLEPAIEAGDCVLIALGVTKLSDRGDKTISTGSDHIMAAMKKKGARRLLVLSAWGDSAPQGGFLLNRVIRPLFLAHPYAEHELQEEAVEKSGLDYTVFRPGRLTNGKVRDLRGSRAKQGLSQVVSRAAVAAFMLAEAQRNQHVGQMILVG